MSDPFDFDLFKLARPQSTHPATYCQCERAGTCRWCLLICTTCEGTGILNPREFVEACDSYIDGKREEFPALEGKFGVCPDCDGTAWKGGVYDPPV